MGTRRRFSEEIVEAGDAHHLTYPLM